MMETTAPFLKEVMAAFVAGNTVQAELLALRRLEVIPHCASSNFVVGALALRRGDEDRAVSYWGKCSELPPHVAPSVYRHAQEALEEGYLVAARNLLYCYVRGGGEGVAPIWLLLGQCFDRCGRADLRLKVWHKAIRIAQHMGTWLNEATTPPALLPQVRHAMQTVRHGRSVLFSSALESSRKMFGEKSLRRVDIALNNYLGLDQSPPRDRRQAPKFFYFPGLSDKPYHDPFGQPWARKLSAGYQAIRGEAIDLLQEHAAFSSFLSFQSGVDSKKYVSGSGEKPAWDAFFFYRHGQRYDDHHVRCPLTSEILDSIERCEIKGQAPEICFSLLAPGTHIMPHYGVTNTRLVMHLPLLVPNGCALNIIDEGEHHWKEGELMMFDDTYQHEAWNRSNEPRLILLMDCWNPELTPEERIALKTLIECISDFENAALLPD